MGGLTLPDFYNAIRTTYLYETKMNHNAYLTSFSRNNWKWFIELSIKPKTVKLLEDNIGDKLCNLGVEKYF